MPIDPNIALGVRPIEQPNMLGQMAQAMAIRQANQEYENEGGLRNALTSGATEDPSSLLQYGKQGRATYESILKGKKEQLESSQKRIDMMGGLAGFVREKPTPENFESSLSQAVSYGLMTPAQKQATLTQYGGSPESIKAYADRSFQQAVTAKDQLFNATSIANNQRTVGASYYGSNVSRENSIRSDERSREQAQYNRDNPTLTPIQGSYQIPDPNAPGGFRQVEGFGGFNTRTGTVTPAQIRAPAAAPTVANSLAALQPAPIINPNVNALNPNFITSAAPASPVVPSAAATAPSASAAIPSAGLPATAAQAGVFKPKPSPQAEKQAQDEIDRARGKGEVANIIGGLASKYNELATTGGMTSTKKGTMENIGSYLANTALGQEAGKMTATQEQSLRNEIRAQSPVLLQGIKKATGMTAKEMDSNADVKRWMEAMGSTTFDVQSTLGILKSLNAQFGSGNEIPAAPAKTGNIASDPAIQTLINKYSK
jgi:hypothetical protein